MEKTTIEHFLKANESMVWRGKPVITPFILSSGVVVLFGLVWLIIPTSMLVVIYTSPSDTSLLGKVGFQIFLIPFFLIGFVMLLAPIYNMLVHRFVEYVVTNQRVIIVGGLIGRDVKVVNFDQIKNIAVEVGLLDKVYETGRIKFFTGEMSGRSMASKYDTFYTIQQPYEVFRVIQMAMDKYASSQ